MRPSTWREKANSNILRLLILSPPSPSSMSTVACNIL
jgi:hypothetical protein